MGIVNKIAEILVLVGALNWGLVGFLQFDLIAALFGVGTWLSMFVYDIVGLSAVWLLMSCIGSKAK